MKTTRNILTVAMMMAAIGLATGAANATTMLVDEDFQSPTYSNGTQNPAFDGWTWRPKSEGGTLYPKSRIHPNQNDVPVQGNQLMQLEYDSYTRLGLSQWGDHDTGDHTWSSGDIYTLTLNASPQSWNGSAERYIRPSLLQQDGTLLWESPEDSTTKLPVYAGFGGNPWTAAQTFTFTIDASTFTTGTEGEPIMLRIGSSGFRGTYFDNVSLTLPDDGTIGDIPEPATMALLGLAVCGLGGYVRSSRVKSRGNRKRS